MLAQVRYQPIALLKGKEAVPLDLEAVVVKNASTDTAAEVSREISIPHPIRIRHRQENRLGLYGGLHRGAWEGLDFDRN